MGWTALGQTLAQEVESVLEVLRLHALAPVRFGRPLKNENSAWWATVTQARIDLASMLRGETTRSKSHIDEQSAKRSRSVTRRTPLAQLLQHLRVRQSGRPVEGAERPSSLRSQPFVRASEVAAPRSGRRKGRQRAEPLRARSAPSPAAR